MWCFSSTRRLIVSEASGKFTHSAARGNVSKLLSLYRTQTASVACFVRTLPLSLSFFSMAEATFSLHRPRGGELAYNEAEQDRDATEGKARLSYSLLNL